MGVLRKMLAATASAGAMLTGMLANDAARLRRERGAEPFAPTPRKPEFKRPGKVASAKRDAARKAARAKCEQQFRKERTIGTDPIYDHGIPRDMRESLSRQWRKVSRVWDQENGGRAT
jgi:hypothetical protein